jgi:hypothetical protein
VKTRSVLHVLRGLTDHREAQAAKDGLTDPLQGIDLRETMDLLMPDDPVTEKVVNHEIVTLGRPATVMTGVRRAAGNVAPEVPKDRVVAQWVHRTRNDSSKMRCALMTTRMASSVVKN